MVKLYERQQQQQKLATFFTCHIQNSRKYIYIQMQIQMHSNCKCDEKKETKEVYEHFTGTQLCTMAYTQSTHIHSSMIVCFFSQRIIIRKSQWVIQYTYMYGFCGTYHIYIYIYIFQQPNSMRLLIRHSPFFPP